MKAREKRQRAPATSFSGQGAGISLFLYKVKGTSSWVAVLKNWPKPFYTIPSTMLIFFFEIDIDVSSLS